MNGGDLDAALNEAERGREQTQTSDPTWNWKFRILEADILLWQHRLDEALQLVEPPLPAGLQSGELAARRNLAQARALYSKGQFDEADARLRETAQVAGSAASLLSGDISLVRGTLLFLRRAYPEAGRELVHALDLARNVQNPILESKVLGTLSALNTAQGFFDAALDNGLASLDISRAIHARHIETITLLNLGWTHLELGDFIQAIPLFKSCIDSARPIAMKGFEERCLNSLGRVYFNMGDYPQASEHYHRALDIAGNLKDHSEIATYSDNIALVELALNHLETAEKYNRDALRIQQETHNRPEELRSCLTTASIADVRKDYASAGQLLNSIISDKETPADVRWQATGELANHYAAMGQVENARKEFPKVLSSLQQVRGTIRTQENRLAFSTWEAGFYSDYISFLVDQHDKAGALGVAEQMHGRALEEGLAPDEAHPSKSPHLTKAQASRLPLAAAHSFLRIHQQVVLYYWLAPGRSFLWVVTPSDLQLFILPAKDKIESLVERYQAHITRIDNVERGDADGQELYRILIQPAQSLIPPNARVVIVPDGALSKLNFETLLVPGDKPHFWLRDIAEEENASSIALLIHSRQAPATNGKSLVMGDPIQVSPDYPKLAHAGDEIKTVTGYLPQAGLKVVPGTAATPSAFLNEHPENFDTIHFATHGTASTAAPLESAIILSPEATGGFKLYAREIIKKRLKANIVTISACYGAGTRTYSGEGLVGLAWAFLRAGAHNVIAGLWKVDDDATPELMNNLYKELGKGGPAAALHAAKMAMLSNEKSMYRFPYYWASLQLYVGS